MLTTVIDLGIGNLQSISNAFKRVGANVAVANTSDAIADAEVLVLPGVGAFGVAAANLRARGFEAAIRRHAVERRRPLIGICLGMQLLADRSFEHGEHVGLGLIPGDVVRLHPVQGGLRVPNIGWLPVSACKQSPMFPPGVDGESFYHVHSYHFVCQDVTDVAAAFDFGAGPIVTAVERGNIFGVQFHPEKSQDAGLNLLASLLAHCAERHP